MSQHAVAVVPPSDAAARDLDAAITLLEGRSIAVLTGAGVSTDSGIPDYRGEGAPARTPMTFTQFLDDLEYRKRYWAGSQLGWMLFNGARPNDGHTALADLESAGVTNGVVTQNVDGLHLRAGSQRVVDLHGAMDRVRCLQCGQLYTRSDISDQILEQNPSLGEPAALELGPDGDVETGSIDAFVLPVCTVCEGTLKPDIVFFGELVPRDRFSDASALVRSAEALLIVGSSLVVNSGIRLLEQAARRRVPVVIINRGATKGDRRAAVKLDAGTSETLSALRDRLIR